jgi:GNAT superfamily N-acetyltransferase
MNWPHSKQTSNTATPSVSSPPASAHAGGEEITTALSTADTLTPRLPRTGKETSTMPINGPARPDRVLPAPVDGHSRLAAGDRFRIVQATRTQWATVEEWIAKEGGDPGLTDADAFFRLDPGGFFLGLLDGEPVSAVSVVNYGPRIAFLGNYLVRPDRRGQGFGRATWRTAMGHAADRAIGLEAIPAQVPVYRRAGFSELYITITYRGRIPRVPAPGDLDVTPYRACHAAEITTLDGTCFPQNRRPFADVWATSPGHRTLVLTCGNEVSGYGVIRPTTRGHQIGPLVAQNEGDALALFDALTAPFPGATVSFHAPEPNLAALLLARARGLAEVVRTVRMYSQPARPIALARCYAIGSLAHG